MQEVFLLALLVAMLALLLHRLTRRVDAWQQGILMQERRIRSLEIFAVSLCRQPGAGGAETSFSN